MERVWVSGWWEATGEGSVWEMNPSIYLQSTSNLNSKTHTDAIYFLADDDDDDLLPLELPPPPPAAAAPGLTCGAAASCSVFLVSALVLATCCFTTSVSAVVLPVCARLQQHVGVAQLGAVLRLEQLGVGAALVGLRGA